MTEEWVVDGSSWAAAWAPSAIARGLLPDLADLKRQAHLKRQQAAVARDFGREELAQLYATESRSLARSIGGE